MIKIAKRLKGKKRKTKTKGDCIVEKLAGAVEQLEGITAVVVGDPIKFNKRWIGPGYYFPKENKKFNGNDHYINLYIISDNVGVAFPAKICYDNGNKEKVIKRLIDYRLGGYRS